MYNTTLILSVIMVIVTLVVPIVAAFVLFSKRIIFPKIFFTGALAFGVAQVILRMPLMNILSTITDWFNVFISTVIGMIVVGGLSAGIFEETARLICAKTSLKDRTDFSSMLSFAFGYAFCEVVLIVGTGSVNTLVNVIMLKNGSVDQMLVSGQITAESVNRLQEMISNNLTIPNVIINIAERISTVGMHIFLTALVFKAVNDKRIIWYFAAILVHTTFNSVIIIPAPIWVLEIILFVLSAMGVFAVVKMKNTFPGSHSKAVLTAEEELMM